MSRLQFWFWFVFIVLLVTAVWGAVWVLMPNGKVH